MMNLFLIFLILITLFMVWLVYTAIRNHYLYKKSRETLPAKGQVWMDCGESFEILEVSSNWTVTIQFDDLPYPEREPFPLWRERLHKRKRYLVEVRGEDDVQVYP